MGGATDPLGGGVGQMTFGWWVGQLTFILCSGASIFRCELFNSNLVKLLDSTEKSSYQGLSGVSA